LAILVVGAQVVYEAARILDFTFFVFTLQPLRFHLYGSIFTVHGQRPSFTPRPEESARDQGKLDPVTLIKEEPRGRTLPRPRFVVLAGIIAMRANANRSV
jgi:hypothetical protein